MIIMQNIHAFNCRSERVSVFKIPLTNNSIFLIGVIGSMILGLAIIEIDLASSRINIGIKYFEDCLWNDALRHFEEAIRINSSYPDAYYWTALTLIQQKKTTRAKELLTKAIELNPNYADAYYQLGLLLKSRSKKKAVEQFNKALSLNLRESFARIA